MIENVECLVEAVYAAPSIRSRGWLGNQFTVALETKRNRNAGFNLHLVRLVTDGGNLIVRVTYSPPMNAYFFFFDPQIFRV